MVKVPADVQVAYQQLGGKDLYAEKMVRILRDSHRVVTLLFCADTIHMRIGGICCALRVW